MKSLAYFVPLALTLFVSAVPIGNHGLVARQFKQARRFAPRSTSAGDVTAPSSCAALSAPPSTFNATLPLQTSNTTSAGNSTDDTTASKRYFYGGDLDDSYDDFDSFSESSSVVVSESESESVYVTSFDYDEYERFCLISGGSVYGYGDSFDDYSCVNWAGIDVVYSLYADADVCLQQRYSDYMISWAKIHGGIHLHDYIDQAISFRRYPRQVIELYGYYPSTPYCLEQPVNVELYGVWNYQYEGSEYGIYGGPSYEPISFGSSGSCPYGMSADVSSCSCVSSVYALGNSTATAYDSDITDASAANSTDTADVASATDATDDSGSNSDSTDTSSADSTDSAAAAAATDDSATATDSSDAAASTTQAADAASNSLTPNVNDPSGRRK